MGFFEKQPASRPTVYQVLQNAQGAFAKSTAFSVGTNQIRVISQNPGWCTINNTTSDATITASGGGVGMFISGNSTMAAVSFGNPFPEYFIVTPGQLFCFASTSTASGAVSITEMS